MKLFNRKQKQIANDQPHIVYRLTQAIEMKKRSLADFLGRNSERLSTRGKRVSLLLFGIIMSVTSVMFMVEPFHHPTIEQVIPGKGESPVILMPRPFEEPMLSRNDFWILQQYKKAFDSLRLHNQHQYQQLLKGHEGLLDSLNYLLGAKHF